MGASSQGPQMRYAEISVVNKDLTFKTKAKAKDLTSEQVEGPFRLGV